MGFSGAQLNAFREFRVEISNRNIRILRANGKYPNPFSYNFYFFSLLHCTCLSFLRTWPLSKASRTLLHSLHTSSCYFWNVDIKPEGHQEPTCLYAKYAGAYVRRAYPISIPESSGFFVSGWSPDFCQQLIAWSLQATNR